MTVLSVGYVNQNELQDSLCVHCVVPQLLYALYVSIWQYSLSLLVRGECWVGS